MSSHATNPRGDQISAKVGHVVPLWMLVAVWAALMVLTYLTVEATRIDLGNLNLVIAMGIATVKAALVVLFFMHMYWETPLNAIIFVSSLLFVALFIILVLYDSGNYQPSMIEGYAPAFER